MWSRTFVGLFFGLILNCSLMLNLAYLVPMPRDLYLLIGFVGGFILWGAIATYYYCVASLKKPLLKGLLILAVSVGVNSLFVLGTL